jgi:ferredoxin
MQHSDIFLAILLLVDFGLFAGALYFAFESLKESERRAPRMGAGIAVLALLIGFLIIFLPILRVPFAIIVCLGAAFGLVLLIPGNHHLKALKGADGHLVEEPVRPDERDIPFARLRSLPPGSEYYRKYYQMHPEREEADRNRREKGLLGKPGGIDGRYPPNVSMIHASFDMPDFLGTFAVAEPDQGSSPLEMDQAKATEIVKKYTLHLGASAVGICRVNPNWVYSHRGEIFYDQWEEWGRELDPNELPPFAVVMLTEMDWEHVSAAPHTPSVAESARNYGKGAYLSTALARWFAHMGYRGVAQNTRRYDIVLPPLAADAGLGEVGRQGYLIAPRFGARVRIFATLTDMPLIPDKAISIGADEFCKRCKKCAESCPSRSILKGDKVTHNGALKWKLNEDTCFEYWSKVGTDCSICMAVCPFSRPNTLLHNLIRWFVGRSPVAQRLFPHMDNVLYGRKWRPKPVPLWLDYHKGVKDKKEVY